MSAAVEQTRRIAGLDERFVVRAFAVFATLTALSVMVSFGGKMLGRSIALAGHSEDTTLREVVIGNNVLAVHGNAIRFERERRDGVASSLHLYLRWPDMQGYTAQSRDDFNNSGGSRNILFLAFEPQMMSRDMSGRFEPIYTALIEPKGTQGPSGLTFHSFIEKSGYTDELLVVGPDEAGRRFVARCLTGTSAAESLAECERDIGVGRELALTYRFPANLLGEWRRMDAAVQAFASGALKTGR